MKERETFNFYRSFYEAGKAMPDSERLEFYDAILQKSFEKNVKRKKLSGIADIVFKAILPVVTNQNRNYINGMKGVKAKKTNPPKNNKTTPLAEKKTTYKEKYKEKEKYKDKDKENNIESAFDSWWELYEKKGNREESLTRWLNLKQEERDKCFHVVTDYVKSTPNKKYRRGGQSYLLKKMFNDEVIFDTPQQPQQQSMGFGGRHGDMDFKNDLSTALIAEYDRLLDGEITQEEHDINAEIIKKRFADAKN